MTEKKKTVFKWSPRPVAVVLLMLFGVAHGTPAAGNGQLQYLSLRSEALQNNLIGDPSYRSVIIYLPPSYSTEKDRHYPVIYLLHGYNDSNTIWRDGGFQGFSIQPELDRLAETGSLREMIVVMPDGRNFYGGSYYTNSPVTGNWEDFIRHDLVPYVDRNFRTLARASSRGVAGHSMGGYGALYLAIRYPDTFSATFGLSACCLAMVGDVSSQNPEWINTLKLKGPEELAGAGIYPNAFTSLAAALSPNPGNPPLYVDYPFRLNDQVVEKSPQVYARWMEHFPATMVESHLQNLRRLRGIRFNVGRSDRFSHILLGSRAFSEILKRYQIPHVYEEYDGDHTSRIGALLRDAVFTFFSEVLEFSPQPSRH